MKPLTLESYRSRVSALSLWPEVGQVRALSGLSIEVEGLRAAVGDLCMLVPRPGPDNQPRTILAEVVALRGDRLVLLSHGGIDGLSTDAEARRVDRANRVPVGPGLLGRVVDAFGQPLDGGTAPRWTEFRDLKPVPRNPLGRPPIHEKLSTGLKVVDVFLTLGKGQRVGLFAGSGVGKSTLLGNLTRNAAADITVVALIGERGREVGEFVASQLDADALSRSIIVAATADQAAPVRVRAAHAAAAMAEHFAVQGRHVLFLMDSLTRFAMARREVGLAAGEPPTARGYTPSVFAELPQLCERFGCLPGGGSVTAVMTVLAEGDDLNDPIADHARSILDGHLVLSRSIAEEGRYPPIDVQQSVSRTMQFVVDDAHHQLARRGRRALAVLTRNRSALEMGLYVRGANPSTDALLDVGQRLTEWMPQESAEPVELDDALASLSACLATSGGAEALAAG